MSVGTESDSSSEDEILKEALKEAADPDLFKDSYFSKAEGKSAKETSRIQGILAESEESLKSNLKSLRRKRNGEEDFENFGVTPSFQKFVAKKLDEIIERSIKLKTKTNSEGDEKKIETDNGIKLLNSSSEFLSAVDEEETEENRNQSKRRKRDENSINEKEKLSMCKEVALEPDWILSKKDTEAWVNKRKGQVFKYKKSKAGLLLEDS